MVLNKKQFLTLFINKVFSFDMLNSDLFVK